MSLLELLIFFLSPLKNMYMSFRMHSYVSDEHKVWRSGNLFDIDHRGQNDLIVKNSYIVYEILFIPEHSS
jgi:hypothetical protein